MNILVLTGMFGSGHVSAAKALEEDIKKEYPNDNVVILDIVKEVFPKGSTYIYKVFNRIANNNHNLYNKINCLAEKYMGVPMKRILTDRLDAIIKNHDPSVIISTLPVSSKYISAYKGLKRPDIALVTCITDIYPHNDWINPGTDYYLAGSEKTKEILIEKKVDKDRIIVTGIPVKQKFKETGAKRYNKSKEVLIMGGGLGIIPEVENIVKTISKMENTTCTIITGTNHQLYEKLEGKYKNITPVKYTNQVEIYMQNADLLITKPGGITLFEAINSQLPMLVFNPFLEQERGNGRFIEENQIGKVLWNKEEKIYEEVAKMLKNEILMESMKKNIERIKENISKENIFLVIEKIRDTQEGRNKKCC